MKELIDILVFLCMELGPLLVECGQVSLLCNQIEGFVGEQYHWKEQIDISDFLHGVNDRGKLASKAAISAWVWLGVPLAQSDCRIL